jgi:plastocyanin
VRTSTNIRRLAVVGFAVILNLVATRKAQGQQNTITAHVEIVKKSATKTEKPAGSAANASDVVVWLNRLDQGANETPPVEKAPKRLQIVQKNKTFQPHLLVVPVGALVDFPNRDPFFHNVFSLFDGKRFDLGLYEAGSTNSVRFDRLGVSFLFCNIHPEMSAVVVAVDTPYYGTSDRSGNVTIPNVPDGKYELHVWYERSLPEDLKGLSRSVTLSADKTSLGTIGVPENPGFSSAHKNKYDQDYTPPPPAGYPHH